MAIFGDSHLRRESTPNFGARSTKLDQIVWVTQKMTQNENRASPDPINGETTVFAFCQKVKKTGQAENL